MQKTYEPKALETKLYQFWEQSGFFKPSGQGKPYCIMLPPPNVTGTLHMGHGFQVTLMDALIRYHRMRGFNTFWQAGTDHAGIATQMVVERQLLQKNISRHDLGREKFLEKVWDWKHLSDRNIKDQLRRMGASMDWDQSCFSLDHGICEAVKTVFESLYDQDLIYRGQTLVNWDPALGSAISDLEVVNQVSQGKLWHLKYPVKNSDEVIVVATTRPETMLGDSAVAVHPDDPRYQHLIGKKVLLPLTQREIPIIADTYVDQAFGSGCVKITPAHDFNDYEIGKRHDLAFINIFTPDAHLNQNVPTKYQGMERFAARKAILDDLANLNCIEKIENHELSVPYGDRSGVILEPYLTDQWFVKSKPLAEIALKAVAEGKIEFVPENWKKTYDLWLEDIHDWCISRQLWWGHRIPAWYDANGKVYVGKDEAAVRKKYQLAENILLNPDEDVLDTWFSSALWPFATLGWPEPSTNFKTFYPTSVLVTGFDIIFFWVARMVMLGLKFTDQIPFEKVYVTGLIRDSEGQKMSKSKGNILDPIDLIDGIDLKTLVEKRSSSLMQPKMREAIIKNTEKEFPNGIPAFGTDALRFTFAALATQGRDIRFDIGRLEGYHHFCNKIWNAARYVLLNTENQDNGIKNSSNEYSIADLWIRAKLQNAIATAHDHFANLRFDLLAKSLYEFIWNEYCDWYLELSKPILNADTASLAQKRGTRETLLEVLETILRLMHPLMPFITEAIWQQVAPRCEIQAPTIMHQAYPAVNATWQNPTIETEVEALQKIILAIRNIRGEMNISPNKKLKILLRKGDDSQKNLINQHQILLMTLAKLEVLEWLKPNAEIPAAATAIADTLEILIPMSGLIDKDAELTRLNKEISKLNQDYEKTCAKLNNESFMQKAPSEVVNKEKTHADALKQALLKLQAKYREIEQLPEKTEESL